MDKKLYSILIFITICNSNTINQYFPQLILTKYSKLADIRKKVRDEFREMKAAYLLFGPFYCACCVLSHLILMFKCKSIPYLD